MNSYDWMDILGTSWLSDPQARNISNEISSSQDFIQKNFGGRSKVVNGRISIRQQSMVRVSDMDPFYSRMYNDAAVDNGISDFSSKDRVVHTWIALERFNISYYTQRSENIKIGDNVYKVVYDTVNPLNPIPTALINNRKEGDTLHIKLREYIRFIFINNDPDNAAILYTRDLSRYKLYDILDCKLVATNRGCSNYGNLTYPLRLSDDLSFEQTFKIVAG